AIARAGRARALVLDYRLAPEHPFPAALEDAVAAYRWLLAQGTAPARLVVAGDSAGGGLTVATLVALRERGLPLPAAGVAISPWVDLTCSARSYATNAGVDPIVRPAMVAEMARAYLGGADPRTQLASPLFADLSGLPPPLIPVARDEALPGQAGRRRRRGGRRVRRDGWRRRFLGRGRRPLRNRARRRRRCGRRSRRRGGLESWRFGRRPLSWRRPALAHLHCPLRLER